ncbi:hypothetical protein BACINT_00503 [Bacteroides intestinalis DSM 17393]|uniref:Uncharacterized protein n=1 Tax=Bacteroides intestinalis DSM 17393 TaxID=471870 RepID=B3C6G8_9BACE|nr:hypothetical protein BACINT_00503 [Bacteroides intestinalis DSM 17393]
MPFYRNDRKNTSISVLITIFAKTSFLFWYLEQMVRNAPTIRSPFIPSIYIISK